MKKLLVYWHPEKTQHIIKVHLAENKSSDPSGRIAEYLTELEEVGFISRDYTWNISTGLDSKLSQYRLKDNYFRFYLNNIKKNYGKIKRGSFSFSSLSNLSNWSTVMGLQFENLVLNNRQLIHSALNLSPTDIINSYPFF